MNKFVFAIIVAVVGASVSAEQPANLLYDELLNKGIAIPGGPTVKLPAPLLRPGELPKESAELLEKASGNVPVELFVRQSATAPFNLKIESVEKGNEERCGQMINLWFIAYGKLDAVVEKDFLKEILGGKGKSRRDGDKEETTLTAEALSKRGIRLLEGPKLKQTFGKLELELLDKVQVEGITQSLRTSMPYSAITATRLDDRFKNDKEYPNRWRHVLRSAEGESLGPLQPYTGLGGYVLVTELPEPKGALLFEMHFLLHEPPEWFGGYNLLRSKMPVKIQENVRSFRRKLTRG